MDETEYIDLYELEDDLLHKYDKFMRLKIFVDSDDEDLKHKYVEAIYNHNFKLKNNIDHIDAGFDLFTPETHYMTSLDEATKIDYHIICSATILKQLHNGRKENNTGFYIYPRSSISKTQIRLANNVGIIDAGYRGHLIGMFDVRSEHINNKFDRNLQICAPELIPIVVKMVTTKEQLGEKTARGEGGFGSTGK